MPFTTPDASSLGCQLRQLMELGTPAVIVGRYAAAQSVGTVPSWSEEQLEEVAQALKMLSLSGADDTLLGQFAAVQVASRGTSREVSAARSPASVDRVPIQAPTPTTGTLKQEVAQLVAAELARHKSKRRATGDRSIVLKVSMGSGRYTTVSVPGDLHARYVKTFGTKAAGSRELAALLASTSPTTASMRSRQIQVAMAAALQAHLVETSTSNIVQLRRG